MTSSLLKGFVMSWWWMDHILSCNLFVSNKFIEFHRKSLHLHYIAVPRKTIISPSVQYLYHRRTLFIFFRDDNNNHNKRIKPETEVNYSSSTTSDAFGSLLHHLLYVITIGIIIKRATTSGSCSPKGREQKLLNCHGLLRCLLISIGFRRFSPLLFGLLTRLSCRTTTALMVSVIIYV